LFVVLLLSFLCKSCGVFAFKRKKRDEEQAVRRLRVEGLAVARERETETKGRL